MYYCIKSNPQFSDCLLDQDMFTVYEKIKAFYSEQLFIWGLWTQRLCVLKASSIQESERERDEHNNLKMTDKMSIFQGSRFVKKIKCFEI